jgi:hypothetical protein
MDPQTSAELRVLRARAYGPAADIHDDPAALARLDELEARVAAPVITAGDEVAAPIPTADAAWAADATVAPDLDGRAPDDGADSAVPAETARRATTSRSGEEPSGARSEAGAEHVEPPAKPRWSRRRLAVIWALSLVLAIAVTAAAVTFVTRRAGYDATVEAVLAEIPDFDSPQSFFGGETRGFAEFYGLVPLSTSSQWDDQRSTACLVLVSADDLYSDSTTSGFRGYATGGGCEAGRFEAWAQVLVTVEMPEQLIDRYPVGTALRFVLEGDQITVLSAPPVEPATD